MIILIQIYFMISKGEYFYTFIGHLWVLFVWLVVCFGVFFFGLSLYSTPFLYSYSFAMAFALCDIYYSYLDHFIVRFSNLFRYFLPCRIRKVLFC